jgi:hypothetical protein
MEPYWDVIERIIRESDLVLEVLDARLVELSRNEKVEELIEEVGRPVIFVINKSDLVPKASLEKHVIELKKKGEVVFLSAKEKGSARLLTYKIKKVFREHGKREMPERERFDPKPKYREARGNIVVGVVGYPNVGKSSIINMLAHKKKMKVSRRSGTTHGIHWIKATEDIKLIDSPGVIPLKKDDEIRYGLIGAKDIDRIKDPELVAHAIIKLFLKFNKKAFEKHYGIDIQDKDPQDIIEKIADRKRFLLKGGRFDENKTFSLIVRDWQQGKLRL